MNVQPIILAGGKGTRMGASDLPKVLVHLKNVPLISWLLKEVEKLGLESRPIVVVKHKYQLVQSSLGSSFKYVFQNDEHGTGAAVKAAVPHVSAEHALILYGDMPFIKSQSLQRLIQHHLQRNLEFTMFSSTVPHFEGIYASHFGFGRLLRENGNLVRNVELVDASDQEKNILEVNPSIYLFQTEWLKRNIDAVRQNKHGEFYLTDLLEIGIRNGTRIETIPVDPLEAFGINTSQQLMQADEILDRVTK